MNNRFILTKNRRSCKREKMIEKSFQNLLTVALKYSSNNVKRKKVFLKSKEQQIKVIFHLLYSRNKFIFLASPLFRLQNYQRQIKKNILCN